MSKSDEMLEIIGHKLVNLKIAIANDKKSLMRIQFAMLNYDLKKLEELVLGEKHPSE